MKSISLRFSSEMEQAVKLVELISSVRKFATVDISKFRSRAVVATHVRTVHRAALEFTSTPIAYDGIYLSICGRFEFTVRELVERFVELIARELPSHNHLPAVIKGWHPLGSADIIRRINEEQFKHLSVGMLVENLASCLHPSMKKPYKLTPEAYSYNDHNFRASEIDKLLSERLGLQKIWQKLARQGKVANWAGSGQVDTIENLCRRNLDGCMDRRNAIIHRGRAYYTPGCTEVTDCANFLDILVDGIADVMETYRASL
ncbi:MAG: hypothetical protein LLG20_18995 [Acidobacteriales bacterium]|nr:hypothetical protein [Terriglobales bacterium]